MVRTDGLGGEAHRSPGHVGEGGHVEDIVVWEEEKIMGIVEPVDVVQLVLKQVPSLVKLIDCQRRLEPTHSRLHPNTHKTLKRRMSIIVEAGLP